MDWLFYKKTRTVPDPVTLYKSLYELIKAKVSSDGNDSSFYDGNGISVGIGLGRGWPARVGQRHVT